MIIVVGGIKGGCGKTTIATNLSVMRCKEGKKVLLVDTDRQKSASIFASQRELLQHEPKWSTIHLSGTTVHSQLARFRDSFDDIIVDAGGSDSAAQRSALLEADILILPFRPRSYDLWTMQDVGTLISEVKVINPDLKCFAFINQADTRGKDNEDTFSILQDCNEFKCLDITIVSRKTFGNSSSDGLGIVEVENPDKKAIQELSKLYNFIYTVCIKPIQQIHIPCILDVPIRNV